MTIAGLHTTAELSDLLKAFDFEVNILKQARDRLGQSGAWANVDATGWSTWLVDEANFENAYNTAAASARDVVNSLTGLGSDSAYTALLTAVQNAPHFPAPGGLDDLLKRLQASPGASSIADLTSKLSNVPQPTAPDADLQIINNPAVKAAANAGQGVANAGAAAAKALGSSSTWELAAVAGAGVLVLLLVAARRP